MTYNKPLPKINGDNQPFWEGCGQHELRFQKCQDCGHVRWPPAILCPQCHCTEIDWIKAGGTGRVYTFAVYHVAYHPGFSDELPYTAAVVELDEGPHFMTNIVGCSPEDVYCDMPVKVVWEDAGGSVTLPKFAPRNK